jgi:hypothetical protein
VALALAAEFLLFVGTVGIGFVAFASNTVLLPSLAGLQEVLRPLMVLVAVAAAILLVRVTIPLGLALITLRYERIVRGSRLHGHALDVAADKIPSGMQAKESMNAGQRN